MTMILKVVVVIVVAVVVISGETVVIKIVMDMERMVENAMKNLTLMEKARRIIRKTAIKKTLIKSRNLMTKKLPEWKICLLKTA